MTESSVKKTSVPLLLWLKRTHFALEQAHLSCFCLNALSTYLDLEQAHLSCFRLNILECVVGCSVQKAVYTPVVLLKSPVVPHTWTISRFGPSGKTLFRLVSEWTSVQFPRSGSPLSSKVVVCGHGLVTLSLTINETLNWLSSLPILMQVILVVTV